MPYNSFVPPTTIHPSVPTSPSITSRGPLSKHKPKRVLVTLKSGRRIMGIYGSESFFDPKERYLYLESATDLPRFESETKEQESHAMIIGKDCVETIELLE